MNSNGKWSGFNQPFPGPAYLPEGDTIAFQAHGRMSPQIPRRVLSSGSLLGSICEDDCGWCPAFEKQKMTINDEVPTTKNIVRGMGR